MTVRRGEERRVRQRRGQKLPPETKSVARPSRWGNPFKLGSTLDVRPIDRHPEGGLVYGAGALLIVDRPLAVALYRSWLLGTFSDQQIVDALGGYDLACYCEPLTACHAEVLLDVLHRTSKGRWRP